MVADSINGDYPEFPEYIEVTDVLDLHGFFPEQVRGILDDFLDNAWKKGFQQVRIIHGKGKSRLKWEVHHVLKDHPLVFEYSDAPLHLGHWGATVVSLKKSS